MHPLSLSLSLRDFGRVAAALIAAAGALPLAAQSPGGVHPSVAQPPAGFVWPPDWTNMSAGVLHPSRSPALNFPDNVWNHGESAIQRDTGGIFGMNLGNQVTPVVPVPGTHVHRYVPYGSSTPEGWLSVQAGTGGTLYPTTTLLRLRGYLRDSSIVLQQPGQQGDRVDDAAFEITVADWFDPALPTAIVISTPVPGLRTSMSPETDCPQT